MLLTHTFVFIFHNMLECYCKNRNMAVLISCFNKYSRLFVSLTISSKKQLVYNDVNLCFMSNVQFLFIFTNKQNKF